MLNIGKEFIPVTRAYVEQNYLNEMVADRYGFCRLGESELFKYANDMSKVDGKKLVEVLPMCIVEGHGFIHLTLKDLEKNTKFQLFDSPTFKISCKKAMMELMEDRIIMIYSDTIKLPTCIPYIIQAGNRPKIYVNVSDFVKLDQFGQASVTQIRNYNGLMAILFAASICYVMIARKLIFPSDITDSMCLLYSGMLTRIVNNIVHLDPVSMDKIKYLSSQFFLIQNYGTNQGVKLFQRIRGRYFPRLPDIMQDTIDNQFKLDAFDNLELFVEEIKRLYPSMHPLTVSGLFNKWIYQYGPATALSLDYMAFNLYNISMIYFESPLINLMTTESIMDKAKGTDAFKRMQSLIETL